MTVLAGRRWRDCRARGRGRRHSADSSSKIRRWTDDRATPSRPRAARGTGRRPRVRGGYQTVALLSASEEATGTFETESEFDDRVSEADTDLPSEAPEEDGIESDQTGENETETNDTENGMSRSR